MFAITSIFSSAGFAEENNGTEKSIPEWIQLFKEKAKKQKEIDAKEPQLARLRLGAAIVSINHSGKTANFKKYGDKWKKITEEFKVFMTSQGEKMIADWKKTGSWN